MALSLQPEHLKRYAQIGRLLVKYGRVDFVRESGLDELLRDDVRGLGDTESEEAPTAEALTSDLERLGPTFIKLGQLLSTRADLLPPAYIAALSRLQDDVEPFDFAEVERIVTSELGVRLSKAFSSFEPAPMAAASLGQVHRATLRDGREVAVKVQRPHIREQIAEDLDAIDELAGMLDAHTEVGRRYGLASVVEEFRTTLLRELDYRREAQNLTLLADHLASFERIVVPRPVESYTTSRVLTMDFVPGRKVTDLGPLTHMEIGTIDLAEELFRAYLKQILVDGFFHADPHPGNVLVTTDGRLGLIDVGMVGYVAPAMQASLLKLLLAVSEGRGEDAAALTLRIGETRPDFDEAEFMRRVSAQVAALQGATAQQIEIGRIVIELSRGAGEAGVRLPPELTTLGKTLLALDQVGRTLDPDFDPNASIRRNAAEMMQRRMLKQASPTHLLSTLLEMNELVQQLPARANQVLETLAENRLRLKVDAIDEVALMSGLQKIANRITLGLILAALIIGAAMLMRVETRFRILGYPGLAMLLFLAAAIGGVLLVLNIVLHDERRDRRRGPS